MTTILTNKQIPQAALENIAREEHEILLDKGKSYDREAIKAQIKLDLTRDVLLGSLEREQMNAAIKKDKTWLDRLVDGTLTSNDYGFEQQADLQKIVTRLIDIKYLQLRGSFIPHSLQQGMQAVAKEHGVDSSSITVSPSIIPLTVGDREVAQAQRYILNGDGNVVYSAIIPFSVKTANDVSYNEGEVDMGTILGEGAVEVSSIVKGDLHSSFADDSVKITVTGSGKNAERTQQMLSAFMQADISNTALSAALADNAFYSNEVISEKLTQANQVLPQEKSKTLIAASKDAINQDSSDACRRQIVANIDTALLAQQEKMLNKYITKLEKQGRTDEAKYKVIQEAKSKFQGELLSDDSMTEDYQTDLVARHQRAKDCSAYLQQKAATLVTDADESIIRLGRRLLTTFLFDKFGVDLRPVDSRTVLDTFGVSRSRSMSAPELGQYQDSDLIMDEIPQDKLDHDSLTHSIAEVHKESGLFSHSRFGLFSRSRTVAKAAQWEVKSDLGSTVDKNDDAANESEVPDPK